MNEKTVIISGANGYFGAIACQYFQNQGWRVLKAMRQEGYDIFLDLNLPDKFSNTQIDSRVDLFIHAAAANEVICRQNPYQSIFYNVAGTKAALDFCGANQIKNFVYISTFHVFGYPEGNIDELTQPIASNDYGLSHLQSEQYVLMYAKQKKIEGTIVRPTNLFGIPADIERCQRWTLVPLSFCKEAIENQKIILKTPGFQRRNFVAATDVCTAILKAYSSIRPAPILHVPGPDTLSIRELALLVKDCVNNYLDRPVNVEVPEGDSNEKDFNYTSRYLEDIYRPSERIKDFIIAFCQELSDRAV